MTAQGAGLLYQAAWAGVLLGGVATAYQLLGLMGYVGAFFPALLVAAASLGTAAFLLYHLVFSLRRSRGPSLFLWALVVIVLASEVILAATSRDSEGLTDHLIALRHYLEAGRILELPELRSSYYPMLAQMLYAPFIGWGWEPLPRWLHGLFASLTGLCLYGYLSARLSCVYGLFGFVLFISVPAVLKLSHIADAGLAAAFYATVSLLALVFYPEDERIEWLVLAGLSAGFAMACRLEGALVLSLFACAILTVWARSADRAVRGSVVFLVLAAAAFSVWPMRNFSWTGNPFFPLFGHGLEALEAAGHRRLTPEEPLLSSGVLSPVLVLFLPWAFRGKWRSEKRLLMGFVVCYLVSAFSPAGLRTSYLLPIAPPLALLTVFAIHNIYLRVRRPQLLFGILALLIAVNFLYFFSHLARGREPRGLPARSIPAPESENLPRGER